MNKNSEDYLLKEMEQLKPETYKGHTIRIGRIKDRRYDESSYDYYYNVDNRAWMDTSNPNKEFTLQFVKDMIDTGGLPSTKEEQQTNKVIAQGYLRQAIQNRDSEKSINDYIKFMDSLPEDERKEILNDPETTRLVDTVNTTTDMKRWEEQKR